MAREFNKQLRGEDLGLSNDEVSPFMTLETNESSNSRFGRDTLKKST